MSKVILNDLTNPGNQTSTVNTINANNAVIETAFDNTLSRDGTSPNQMNASLDMNSNHIINLPTPASNYEPIRLIDVNTINGSGITVSPLPIGGTAGQVLTKLSSTNFDTNWLSPSGLDTVVVTPEQFGYTSYGSGDAGPAIMNAVNSVAGKVTVVFGNHTYNVVTPVVINKDGVSLVGQGYSSQVRFTPIANGTLFKWENTGLIVTYSRLKDLNLTSSDTSFTQIAVELIDVSDMEMSGVLISGLNGLGYFAGVDSIGLKTNGRQTSEFYNLKIFTDKPIVIGKNPNHPYLCADHFHFYDLYCIGRGTNPIIIAQDGVVFTNTTFDGSQAWVLGSAGFYYNDTTSVARSYNLSFSNVRTEQTPPSGNTTFTVITSGGLASLSIKNCSWDTTVNGILLFGVLNTDLEGIYYPAITSTQAIGVIGNCKNLAIRNCRWEVGATKSLSGMTTKFEYFTTGASTTVPSDGLYNV